MAVFPCYWLRPFGVFATALNLLHLASIGRMIGTASVKSGSPPGSSPSNGTKRKRSNEVKYYAVRVGYQPGIYHTWADCLDQVKGFKRATCQFGAWVRIPKSLTTYDQSNHFLRLVTQSALLLVRILLRKGLPIQHHKPNFTP